MSEYLAYHNPERMGYAAREVDSLAILTNKRIPADLMGSRIWLVTGEGRPRRYSLSGYFFVDDIQPLGEEGFRTTVSGTEGRLFRRQAPVDREPWFEDLKRAMGHFAFGLQALKDPRFVRGLQAVARRAR